MKTLKFMLAAATAIGLASATQAEQYTGASTGFEKLAQDTPVITGVTDNDANSYFYYAGATAADNESKIVAAPDLTGAQRPTGVTRFTGADTNAQDNVLQVSTGTEPLLRTFAALSGSAPQAAATFTDPVYVDTLVQFTVTPVSDNVVPSNGVDRLMIYLAESTNWVNDAWEYSTNLVVVGGYRDSASTVVPRHFVVTKFVDGENLLDAEVNPQTWYRLTVEARKAINPAMGTWPGFKVYINGKVCKFDQLSYDSSIPTLQNVYRQSTDATGCLVVHSLLADGSDNSAKLQAVGFAGEGYVDDLVVTTTDPLDLSIVDFVLTNGGNAGPVSFTVNGGEAVTAYGTYEVHTDDTIVVTASAAEGYELIAPTFSGLTADPGNTYALATYTVTGAASLTINTQEAAAQADWADDYTTVSNKTAAEVYSDLAKTALSNADAVALTEWAKANSVTFSEVTADPDDYVEAFLLNCAVAEVDDEKDEFTLTITFDSEGNPVIQSPVDRKEKTYNGTVIIKGSTTVNGSYTSPAPSDAKFYKAELSL